MKKIIGLFVFALCTAFINYKNVSVDFRDAYVGRYFCKYTQFKKAGLRNETSSTGDTLSVFITKDVADSVLQLSFGRMNLKAKLNNKNLRAYPSGGTYAGMFFASDSLTFVIKVGHASSHQYIGKKQ